MKKLKSTHSGVSLPKEAHSSRSDPNASVIQPHPGTKAKRNLALG